MKLPSDSTNSRAIHLRALLSIGLPIVLLVLGMRHMGWLERYSMQAFDWCSYIYASKTVSPHVTVIAITSEDLTRFAEPRGKETMLRILKELEARKPKVIVFTEALNPNSEPFLDEFATALLDFPHGYALAKPLPTEIKQLNTVPKSLQKLHHDKRLFMSASQVDYDGMVRRLLLGRREGVTYYPSLPVRAAHAYLNDDKQLVEQLNAGQIKIAGVEYPFLSAHFGEYQIAFDDESSDTILFSPAHWGGVKLYSFSDLIDGKVPTADLYQKAIFVGTHARDLTVTLNMPVASGWNKVSVYSPPQRNALMADSVISAALGDTFAVRALPNWLNMLWVAFWTFLAVFWLAPVYSAKLWIIRASVIVLLMTSLCLLAFGLGWWLSWVPALLGILATTIETIRRVLVNERYLRAFVGISQSVLDALPEPVFVKDGHGRIRLVNEAFCHYFAHEPSALVGQPLSKLWPQLSAKVALSPSVEFVDGFGRGYRANVEVSRLPSQLASEDLLFGMIQTLEPVHHSKEESLEVFAQRLSLLQIQAQRKGNQARLISVRVNDYQDVSQSLGPDTALHYVSEVKLRLQTAFPGIESLTQSAPDRILLLELGATEADAIDRVNSAFNWPISIADEVVDADLSTMFFSIALKKDVVDALLAVGLDPEKSSHKS
jgi:CHASE2 domain-containing sensor protein